MKTGEMDIYKNVPAFLVKLWNMVNDTKSDHLICWGKDGTTFKIRNEIDFLCIMLPTYYKHNKMSSFIRQLNMYGFRKVSMINMKDSDEPFQFEFTHQCFKRGHPDLLVDIKRKVNNSSKYINSPEKPAIEKPENNELSKLSEDVKGLCNQQAQMNVIISNLKKENTVLWREIAMLRQKYSKQSELVNRLIHFLVTVVQPAARRGGSGVKRRFHLMLNENPEKRQKLSMDGPTIHELDNAEVLPDELLQYPEEQDVEEVESADTNQDHQNEEFEIPNGEIFDPEVIITTTPNLENKKSEDLVEELLGDTNLREEIDIPNNLEENFTFTNGDDGTLMDSNYGDVFLNSSPQDPVLANLTEGSYNTEVLNECFKTNSNKQGSPSTRTQKNMTLAKYPNASLLNPIDTKHQDATQSEIDQFKEFLTNCGGSIDSTYLLNLFNDSPTYGLHTNLKDETAETDATAGSELTPYEPLDFNSLSSETFDDDFKRDYLLSSPLCNEEELAEAASDMFSINK
ncbi:hypothetical protein FQA39_LY04616 [Lamprigera yunnana]|nr:hypothetical protein FQA39_LY04616 [Lamprigera yunnana]